jgi:hypothetical protein
MRHPLIPKNRSCSIIDWPTGQETVLIQARAAERRRNSVQCAWPNPLSSGDFVHSLSSECDNLCHCLVTFTSQQPLEDILLLISHFLPPSFSFLHFLHFLHFCAKTWSSCYNLCSKRRLNTKLMLSVVDSGVGWCLGGQRTKKDKMVQNCKTLPCKNSSRTTSP